MAADNIRRMKADAPTLVLWRRKWIVLGVFFAFALSAAVVSKALPKVYATDAKLIVSAQSKGRRSTRSRRARRSPVRTTRSSRARTWRGSWPSASADGTTKDYVLNHTSSEPIAQTQLIRITAADGNPGRAKHMANTFAAVFVDYARRNLVGPTEATLSVADIAPFPTEAARPKPTLYTLVAGLLGLALGVALAFLRDRLDRRLRTPADVESRFEIPVLARVPRRGRSDTSISAFNEAHRILRTSLQFAAGKELKSIAITSGAEGEGKTTTVVQLAVASAEVGLRVAILEADLRRPVLQQRLCPIPPSRCDQASATTSSRARRSRRSSTPPAGPA